MKSQVTIRDIALKLNVSISTVSRALRGVADINADTKKAVLDMAQKLNYEPNLVAQSLRTNKTNTLGIIVPDLVTHFFSACISGIQELAAHNGYNVMICQSNECLATEINNVHTLVASRVDGLLISLSRETNVYNHLQFLIAKNIPVVFFDRVCAEIEASTVIVDDHDGAFKATRHLIEMGYKRIAHLSGPPSLLISKNRLQGYLDALQHYNISPDQDLILNSTLSNEDIITQTNRLLNMPSPPDAIFAINDPTAIQVMLVLKERGIKIPDEIALIGFTNEPVSALIEPSLTTVAQPAFHMGQTAAGLLLEQIHHPDSFVPQCITLKTELIVRNSSTKPITITAN
jgi:DNA-binding LacI/PurR family transcriptional regulator